ncbi:MAG: hypothetical protein JNJ69_01045 [Leptospiraceae bacterium]|nr:hypothetical protein [Leptospiraceae bacterium]
MINLSLPRSGTVSFAGILDRHRSTHEFMISETILALLDFREKKLPLDDLKSFLRERDLRAGHRIDSASFFYLAPEAVFAAFPEAGYFFAVRDCESWIVSMVDNAVHAHKKIQEGHPTVNLDFLERYSRLFISGHRREWFLDDGLLKKYAGHISRELARFWRQFTLATLQAMLTLQSDKRLIIRLENFNQSLPAIARLAGVSSDTLNTTNIHLNKDRRFAQYRDLLGAARLASECRAGQTAVDQWLQLNNRGY